MLYTHRNFKPKENVMPIKKVTHANDKSNPKYFTGGKPKDFELITASAGARIYGAMDGANNYRLFIGNQEFQKKGITHSFTFAAMRELADHLNELADITDEKVTKAA